MKKLILASLVLLSASCDKDNSYDTPEGVYTAGSELGQISVDVSAGKCTSVSLISEGSRYYWTDVNTTGEYPYYTYSLKGFSVRARYINNDSFTGSLSGALVSIDDGPNLTNSFVITVEGMTQIFSKQK